MFIQTRTYENAHFFLRYTQEKRDYAEKMGINYSTFGAPLPGRNFNSAESRYGFNSQEKDDEMFGNSGTCYTAEFWQYDARLGRRWNVDPKPNVAISPYACFENNPLLYSDPDGDTVKYEYFRDRVNVFFARMFNKSFRQTYNTWKNSANTYTIMRRDLNSDSKIQEGGNASQTGVGTFDIQYTNGIPRLAMDGEMTLFTVNIDNRRQETVTKTRHVRFPFKRHHTLRRLVAGTPVTMSAASYPDNFQLYDPNTNTTVYNNTIVDPNPDPFTNATVIATQDNYMVQPGETKLKLTVSTTATATRQSGRVGTEPTSWYQYTYTKWTGIRINFSIKLPTFKLE